MYEEVFLKIMVMDRSLYLLLKSFEIKYNFNSKSSFATYDSITFGKDFESSNIDDRIFIAIHELLHIVRKHVLRNTIFVNDKKFNNKSYNIVSDFIINNELLYKLKLNVSNKLKHEAIFSIPGVPYNSWENNSVEELLYSYMNYINEFAEHFDDYIGDLPSNIESGEDLKESDVCTETKLPKSILEDKISKIIDSKIKTVSSMIADGYIRNYDNIIEPNTDWRSLLKQRLTSGVYNTWSKLNRRCKLVPGRIKTKQNINIYIDVSGSISSEEINMFIGELHKIISLNSMQGNIIFWSIGPNLIINLKNRIPENISSRGGTYFRDTWIQTAKLRKKDCRNVVLSDFEFDSTDTVFINSLTNVVLVGTQESKEIKNIIVKKEVT